MERAGGVRRHFNVVEAVREGDADRAARCFALGREGRVRGEGDGRDLDGKVVVALTEDGNTLKRLFWDGKRPRLHPENADADYRDLYPERLTIQGVALRVIKEIV